MFTALVLVCANTVMNPDTCYFMTSPVFYNSYNECAVATVEMLTENKEMIEFLDEENQLHWKITDIKCVNWKEVRV